MTAPTTPAPDTTQALPRSIGLHGRVAVLSAMAGGTALGGVLVAAMTLSGRLSGNATFLTATGLFIVGAVIGLLHGTVLGYLGRPAGVTSREAAGGVGRGVLYAVPGLAVAWLASIWVSLTLVAFYTGRPVALASAAAGWIASGIIIAAAVVHAMRAVQNAWARWPERHPGSLIAATSFAALMVLFLSDRPEIWGLRLRLTETGAVLMAALVSIWIAGPVVTLALRLARHVPFTKPMAGLGYRSYTVADLTIGLVAGLILGLIAVPFAGPSVASASAGSVVVGVSQALVDTVLLRLFLVTGTAWLLLRWNRIQQTEALVGAVLIAAAIQMALYTPGALAIGFATPAALAGFMVAAVLIPAAVLGAIFWRRGFAPALVANVVALVLVAVIV